MNKFYYFAASAALLSLASCSQEDMPVNYGNGDGNCKFTVCIPTSMGSRAFTDGTTAKNLEIAVFDAKNGDAHIATLETKDFQGKNQLDVDLNLASGHSYKIAFFAHKKEGSAYEFVPEEGKIKVDYSKMAEDYNEDNYDCFYYLFETGTIESGIKANIPLLRPVAQLNWGTNDISSDMVTQPNVYDKDKDGKAKNLFANVKSMEAYTEFDMMKSDVVPESKTEVSLGFIERPSGEKFPSTDDYEYLSMCYLLVPKGGTLTTLTLEVTNDKTPEEPNVLSTVKVTDASLQPNFRTNIFGSLLTNPTSFTVTKSTDFGGDDINIKYVSTTKELTDAIKEGGSIILVKDVTNNEKINIDKEVDINVGTHKLTTTTYMNVIEGGDLKITGSEDENGNKGEVTVGLPNTPFLMIYDNANVDVSNVTINYGDMTGKKSVAIFQIYNKGSKLTVKDCDLYAQTCALSTNATNPDQCPEVYFENVNVYSEKGSNATTPMLINIPVTFKAKDCYFEGQLHAFFMRGGTYDFENCTFKSVLDIDDDVNTKEDIIKQGLRNMGNSRQNWISGDYATLAAVTMGNNPSYFSDNLVNYHYPTNVTMRGCTVTIPEIFRLDEEYGIEATIPAVYAFANQEEGNGVTFTYDDKCTFIGALEFASPNIIVNGEPTMNYFDDWKAPDPQSVIRKYFKKK